MANKVMYDYSTMDADQKIVREVRDWNHEAYATRTGQLWPNAGSGQTAARQ